MGEELEKETSKRIEIEEAYELLKEELIKRELNDSKHRSELQYRIDSLEQEKSSLHARLARLSEQYEQGDLQLREK